MTVLDLSYVMTVPFVSDPIFVTKRSTAGRDPIFERLSWDTLYPPPASRVPFYFWLGRC